MSDTMQKEPRKDITQCVFARIQEEGITPKPKWHFLMREGVVWSLGGVSVAVGALAVAVTLFEVRNTRWEMYDVAHTSFIDFCMDAVPFIWLGTFALFAVVAYAFVRSTKGGYRYRFETLMAVSLVASGVCGVVLYSTGAGAFLDEEMDAYMPLHHSLVERERMVWESPGEGRIAGIVREVSFAEPLVWIEGLGGTPHALDVSDFSLEDRRVMRVGDMVRVIGIPSTTTAHALHGCLMFMVSDDILRKAHGALQNEMHKMHVGMVTEPERNILVARTTECRSIRPYTRFLPLAQ